MQQPLLADVAAAGPPCCMPPWQHPVLSRGGDPLSSGSEAAARLRDGRVEPGLYHVGVVGLGPDDAHHLASGASQSVLAPLLLREGLAQLLRSRVRQPARVL